MQSKAETAWLTAAKCAKLAQEAEGTDEREFYTRMRDAWITVANRYEFLDVATDTPSAPRINSRGARSRSLAI